MRKYVESGSSMAFVLVLTIFLAVSVSATSFDAPSPEPDTVLDSGERVNAFSFDVLYGGDENFTGDTGPGTDLKEFIDDKTMFVNQTSPDEGENGYDNGEDIINVSLAYSQGTPSDFNSTEIGFFGSDVYFFDGSVDNNSVYDGGDEMVGPGPGETVVKSSSGLLDNNSEVLVEGKINAQDLSPSMKYIESGNRFAPDIGVYGDEVLINSSDDFLNRSDEIFDFGGDYQLDSFTGDTTRYLEANSSQSEFVSTSAIVRETASNDNVLEEADYGVVKDGKADILWLNSTNMLHGGDRTGFQEEDPLYYSKDDSSGTVNGYVNISDIRLGDYMVYSRSGKGVTLGQDLFHVMNSSDPVPESNDFGKSLDTYYGGQFYHYEYNGSNPTTNAWDPQNSADQDVLFYAKNGTLGAGDIVVYDQRPENDNITVDPGEEMNKTEYQNLADEDFKRTVRVDIGYNDSDGDVVYTAGDQVVLNVSDSTGNHVVLSPEDQFNNITSDNYNNSRGQITHWNTSNKDDIYSDGLYIAMNDTTQVSTGDLRIGHWNKSVSSGDLKNDGNGTVEASDLDVGANLFQFQPVDDFAVLDRDHDGSYDPGIGRISDNDKGREAVIGTDDRFLNSSDTIVREGKMPSSLFDTDTRYFDSDGSGFYDYGEAVVRYSGGFDNQSEVIIGGKANISSLDPNVRYIETGSDGFHPGSDPLIFDSLADGEFTRGVLDRSVSSDYVFTDRKGNLQNFNRSLNSSGDNASVFLDSNNEDGVFDVGEEILEVELLRNGSSSENIDGRDIVNFADSTKHDGEAYSGTEAIVNDTDGNGVYQNIVDTVSISNVIPSRPEGFFEEASKDHITEVNLYRYNGTDYNLVTELPDSSDFVWSEGISENITEDTEFRIQIKSAPDGDLEDKAYGFEGRAEINVRGGPDGAFNSDRSYIVDNHAPELVDAWTGSREGGDSSSYNQVFVKTNEKYSNLDYSTVGAKDFRIKDKNLLVTNAEEIGTNDVLLTLNDTLESNRTLDVNLSDIGSIRDVASNAREADDINVKDGLRPILKAQSYHDLDENSIIDAIKLEFSENISYNTFQRSDWKVTERQLDDLSVDDGTVNNNDTFILEASAKDNITGVEMFEPFLDYDSTSIVDNSGNALSRFNKSLDDRAAPRIKNASAKDEDSDARIDTVDIEFTEPVSDSDSELMSSSFNVTDAEILDVNSISGDENLSLEISSELLTSETPNVTVFNNSIFDFDGNSINLNQTYDGIKDKADPVLLHAQINTQKSDYGTNFVDLKFSEPVTGNNENITLEESNISFETSGPALERTLNYTQLLPTGDMPNITGVYDITDSSGNTAKLIDSENVTVNSFRKQIDEEWNFVSFPIADESTPAIQQTINTSKIDVIWTYKNKEWQIYDPEASENDFTEFEGGTGYMVNASEEFVLNPNVNTVRKEFTGRDLIDGTHVLSNGFNLVGTFQEHAVSADGSGAFSTLDATKVGAVYEQAVDGKRITDAIRNTDGTDAEDMSPGEAYWMFWQGEDGTSYREPETGGG